jgi:Arc/MetJ family transcription regulator
MVYGKGGLMSRTNIVLNDDLVQKALRLTGAKSKRLVVQIALERLIHQGDAVKALRQLKGKLNWEGDLDSMRKNRP